MSAPAPRRLRLLRLVVALAASAIVLTGCNSIYDLPLPGGAHVGSNPIKLHVMFRDVLDLVPQSTVKVDDVTVGKVTAVNLKGYAAEVTIEVPSSLRIPTNELAEIQQTSLLGEKFVDLEKPAKPSGQFLKTGDTIRLSRTGRDPEVEEVFSALSALLNGGGVAQLKTIATQLNEAIGGRESEVRDVLTQIHTFMGELDANKTQVIAAIDNVNKLSVQLHHQEGTIRTTLADLPSAIRSVNTQRSDLVKMLQALGHLSNVGVHVIEASKEATINSLSDLAPVLTQLAKAGESLPKALQIGLTYPFLDAAVGNSPTVARNLHIGDYTDLSVNAQLDLGNLQLTGIPGAPTLSTLIGDCESDSSSVLCTSPVVTQLLGTLCSSVLQGLGVCTPGSSSSTTTSSDAKAEAEAAQRLAALSSAVGSALGGLFGNGATGQTGTTGQSGSAGTGSGGGLSGILQGFGLGGGGRGANDSTAPSASGDGSQALLMQGVSQ